MTRRVTRLILVMVLALPYMPLVSQTQQVYAALPAVTLNAVTFVPSSSVAIAVGAGGTILRSKNDGATWTSVGPGGMHNFEGVSFVNSTQGWAITRSGGVFRSTDAGATWEGPLFSATNTLYPTGLAYDVAFTMEGQRAVGHAAGGLVSSLAGQDKPRIWWPSGTDGGGQWSKGDNYDPYRNPAGDDGYQEIYRNGSGELFSVTFPASTVGYAVGHDRFNQWWSPVQQHNKGLIGLFNGSVWSWKTLTAGSGALYGVSFATSASGMAVGTSGKVFKTVDSGNVWVSAGKAGADTLRGVAMSSVSKAWVAGDAGAIYQTTNGGTSWSSVAQVSGVSFQEVAVKAAGSNTALAVGTSGCIMRTTNGASWSRANEAVPPTGSVAINSGASSTNSRDVTITHSIVWGPEGPGKMRHSTDGGASWTPWEPYSDAKQLSLSEPDGTKTVRAEFEDGVGTRSAAPMEASIVLDTVPPNGTIKINGGDAATSSANVTVGHTVDWTGSGPGKMRHSTDGGSQWTAWTAYASEKVVTLPPPDGTKTVKAQFEDAAGNVSVSTISASITLNTTQPEGTISINGGAPQTNSAKVTLSSTVNWSAGSAGQMRFSVDGAPSGDWVPYVAQTELTLPGADGDKTVHAEFKDAAGLASTDPIKASIVLDTIAPAGSVSIHEGAYTNQRVVTSVHSISDAGTGVAEMRHSFDGGSTWLGGGEGWVAYAATRALALPRDDGTKSIRSEFRDAANNVFARDVSVTLDMTPPTGGILINNGDAVTTQTTVTVNNDVDFGVSGPDAAEAMRFHNGNAWNAWEPYATTKTLTLPAGDGTKTVYAEFRDKGGNIASFDRMILLTTARPTLTIEEDAAGVVFDRFVTGKGAAYSGGGYIYGRWAGTRM
ncbi:MAG: YCF48-related protein, partial [Coriobacteriia bacterium]|nr:YCF48-related protein [Coriobacteriia bacterium]